MPLIATSARLTSDSGTGIIKILKTNPRFEPLIFSLPRTAQWLKRRLEICKFGSWQEAGPVETP
jgi:hypothetical protein